MRLCVINNIIMLLIIIVLGKISYNILRNKKNYETFTNSGWKLNQDGQLCNDSNCKDISVLGSGDSGKICTISGDTLNCDDITTTSGGGGNGGGDVVGCIDSGATNYNPDATLPGSCTQPSGGDSIIHSNNSIISISYNPNTKIMTFSDKIILGVTLKEPSSEVTLGGDGPPMTFNCLPNVTGPFPTYYALTNTYTNFSIEEKTCGGSDNELVWRPENINETGDIQLELLTYNSTGNYLSSFTLGITEGDINSIISNNDVKLA